MMSDLQLIVIGFMSTSTLEFSCPNIIGVVISAAFLDGSQLSRQILICFPSPTLHIAPLDMTSRPFKILFQAYDAEDESFASKIVPLGKNLDLKTIKEGVINMKESPS